MNNHQQIAHNKLEFYRCKMCAWNVWFLTFKAKNRATTTIKVAKKCADSRTKLNVSTVGWSVGHRTHFIVQDENQLVRVSEKGCTWVCKKERERKWTVQRLVVQKNMQYSQCLVQFINQVIKRVNEWVSNNVDGLWIVGIEKCRSSESKTHSHIFILSADLVFDVCLFALFHLHCIRLAIRFISFTVPILVDCRKNLTIPYQFIFHTFFIMLLKFSYCHCLLLF